MPQQGFDKCKRQDDYFIKLTYLIPCTIEEDKVSAAQVAKLQFENIVRFLEC